MSFHELLAAAERDPVGLDDPQEAEFLKILEKYTRESGCDGLKSDATLADQIEMLKSFTRRVNTLLAKQKPSFGAQPRVSKRPREEQHKPMKTAATQTLVEVRCLEKPPAPVRSTAFEFDKTIPPAYFLSLAPQKVLLSFRHAAALRTKVGGDGYDFATLGGLYTGKASDDVRGLKALVIWSAEARAYTIVSYSHQPMYLITSDAGSCLDATAWKGAMVLPQGQSAQLKDQTQIVLEDSVVTFRCGK